MSDQQIDIPADIAAITDLDLMDGVLGSGMHNPWWIDMTVEGIWEDPLFVHVESWNKEEEYSYLATSLTMDDLRRGLAIAIEKNYHHCGGPTTSDIDDWDACVADQILQCAVYGEEIYA